MDKLSFPGWSGPAIGAIVALGIGLSRGIGPEFSVPWLVLWAVIGAAAGGVVWLADAWIRRRRLYEAGAHVRRPAVESPVARSGLWFGLILTISTGSFVGYLGVERFLAARRMASWPMAEATILESSVRESSHTNLYVTTTSYSPVVCYRYVAGGAEREGRVIDYGPLDVSYDERELADAVVARYPRGSVCPVHYDPADPDQTILEPGMTWSQATPFIVFPITAFGIAIICALCLRAEGAEVES